VKNVAINEARMRYLSELNQPPRGDGKTRMAEGIAGKSGGEVLLKESGHV
jgi:hypothetical protein